MSESAARAERFGLPASSSQSSSPSTSSPSYLWEVANKPVAVRINLETVDRLEREVVDSFRSLSSRGSEIGGLLLGSVQSGNPARVSIEAFELVPCDYVRGPLYQFSEADAERFDRAAEQRNTGSSLRVVGFFRSHTRKGLGLDAEDVAFFTGHFRDPNQIALLIRPYASKPSTAGIFMWENGTVRGEASYQEIPFRRSELERLLQESKAATPEKAPSNAEPEKARAQIVPIASRREITATPPLPERPVMRAEPAPEPAAPPRLAEKPAPHEPAAARTESPAPSFTKTPAPAFSKTPAPSFNPPAPPVFTKPTPPPPEKEREAPAFNDLVLPPLERPQRSKMVWITAGSALVLLLLSGALIYPGLGHKNKPAPAAEVQDRSPLSLRVERSAGELLLTWNRDSDVIKNAARASLTIADGDQHENVNLDLSQLRNGSVVYSPTGSDVSFQLSIIGQNSTQTSSESVRVLRTRPSPMAENPPAPAPQKATPAPTRMETASAPAPPAAPEPTVAAETKSKPAASALREFHAESLSQRLRPAKTNDLPEAPGLIAAAPVAVPLPGLNSVPGAPIAPPVLAPPPPAPAARPTSTATPKSGGSIQQAQLISSKPPEYPLVAKQAHVQGVVVVSATVGVDGRVKAASAVSGPPLLQKAAVDSVKQWVYKPTTLNGAPVESETRVEVKFTAAH